MLPPFPAMKEQKYAHIFCHDHLFTSLPPPISALSAFLLFQLKIFSMITDRLLITTMPATALADASAHALQSDLEGPTHSHTKKKRI
jgi:hypothetical protein